MLIPMKKVTLIFLKEDKREMLESLQRGGQLMIIAPEDEDQENPQIADTDRLQREQAQSMLKLMDSVVKKNGFFVDRPKIEYKRFMEANERGKQIADDMNAISESITYCSTRISTAESQNDALEPWLDLTIPTSELVSGRYVKILTGFIPENVVQPVQSYIAENDAELHLFGTGPEGRASVLMIYAPEAEEVAAQAKELGFNESAAPQTELTPREVFAANETVISGAEKELATLHTRLEGLSGDRDDLELLIQQLVTRESRETVPYSGTVETMKITGWIREDRQERLKEDIERVTEVSDSRRSSGGRSAAKRNAELQVPRTVRNDHRHVLASEARFHRSGSSGRAMVLDHLRYDDRGRRIRRRLGYSVLDVQKIPSAAGKLPKAH